MNYTTAKGYYTPASLDFEKLVSGETEIEFAIKAPTGKDQMDLLVLIGTESASNHNILCLGANGYPDHLIDLKDGNLNVARIPTLGHVDDNGFVNFLFVSGYGSITSIDVSVAMINHIDVINN